MSGTSSVRSTFKVENVSLINIVATCGTEGCTSIAVYPQSEPRTTALDLVDPSKNSVGEQGNIAEAVNLMVCVMG